MRGDLIHNGSKYGHDDGLLLIVFQGYPFTGGGKACLEERYILRPMNLGLSLPLVMAGVSTATWMYPSIVLTWNWVVLLMPTPSVISCIYKARI